MKLLHTSDWHLGHVLHDFDRGPEHDAFLDWLLALIGAERPNALVVTGDIYDAVNPQVAAQQRLFRFLARALDEADDLQIVLTGGNHDSAARIELPRALLDERRVHLVGSMPRGEAGIDPARVCIPLRDAAGRIGAVCAAVPYLRPGDLGEGGAAAIYAAAAESAVAAHGEVPLIVTGHLSVTGGEVSALSERRIVVGGEETVPATIFPARACYVALGHLHRPQRIAGPMPIHYAGSPIPLSGTERDYRHSVCLVEPHAPPEARVRCVPVPRTVPFHRVPDRGAAPLEEIEACLRALPEGCPEERDRHPYLEIAVALTGPEPDLRRRIDAALSGRAARLTRVERVVPMAAEAGGDAAAAVPLALGDITPEAVFLRCHQERFGTDPSDSLLAAFRELLASPQVQEGAEADAP